MIETHLPSAAGFVLIGGSSRRFGSDKAVHELDGEPAADRAAHRLVDVCERGVRLVGRLEAPWSAFASAPDSVPEIGPLGGVATALDLAETEYAVILATDLWNVTSATLRELLRELDKHSADEVDVVCATTKSGHVQPLCGAWRVATCRPMVRRRIEEGEYSMLGTVESLRSRYIIVDALELVNVNSREDVQSSFGESVDDR